MRRYEKGKVKGKRLFVGVDLHRLRWQVTERTEEVEFFNGSITGGGEAGRKRREGYRGWKITLGYEAGYFGFWLYDKLMEYGAECIVTPPSLVPGEYGNRVKTDRRDNRKLAEYLAKGMLKRGWVPTPEEWGHR